METSDKLPKPQQPKRELFGMTSKRGKDAASSYTTSWSWGEYVLKGNNPGSPVSHIVASWAGIDI